MKYLAARLLFMSCMNSNIFQYDCTNIRTYVIDNFLTDDYNESIRMSVVLL